MTEISPRALGNGVTDNYLHEDPFGVFWTWLETNEDEAEPGFYFGSETLGVHGPYGERSSAVSAAHEASAVLGNFRQYQRSDYCADPDLPPPEWRDDVQCGCVGVYGPNPDCCGCGGDGVVSRRV